MMELKIDPTNKNQSIITTITVDNEARRVRFDIVYKEYVDKWYVSLYDVLKEEFLCTNIPLISSYELINDLFKPYHYKHIGMLICFPAVDEPETEDPSEDNLDEFHVCWGERI